MRGCSAAGLYSGGTASPPFSRKTSCAGAPDAGSCPPSPALAGGARFALAICAATGRGTKRATRALLLETRTIRGDGGAAKRHREGRDAHAGFKRPTREAARGVGVSNVERSSWDLYRWPRHEKRAKRASPASAGVEGGSAGIGRASARCLALNGGRRSLRT